METPFNDNNIAGIVSRFAVKGEIAEIKPFGSGHINSTYYIRTAGTGSPDYLLQKINHFVFKNVPGLLQNILYVTGHLKKKLGMIPGADPDREVLTLIPVRNEGFYTGNEDEGYWRMYYFIKDTKSYDIVETEKQAFETGRAFGKFQKLLADLDSSKICETIPDFHNIESRLRQMEEAVAANAAGRVNEVMPIVDFIRERAWEMNTVLRAGREGKLPLRIIHYDTKLNNVLLDKNDHVQCVIDLDTVMPGYVAYDFGDAIRTIINTAAEDEKDLSKINLNLPLFEAYTKGYFEEAAEFLTLAEVESLLHGALLLPYMQTVRFLTDYIQGDIYYKIHFPGHNLQRTLAQLELVKRLEGKRDLLGHKIEEIAAAFNKR